MTRTVGFARRRDVQPSSAARAFRELLQQHLAEAARRGALPRGTEVVARRARSG
jgi:hypothetical protein